LLLREFKRAGPTYDAKPFVPQSYTSRILEPGFAAETIYSKLSSQVALGNFECVENKGRARMN
jgi:hypothetical protein